MNSRTRIAQQQHVFLILLRASRPGRLMYLALMIAVSVAAWFALAALASPFLAVHTNKQMDRIMVTNGRGGSKPVPLKYRSRLAVLPGVAGLRYLDLQMLACGTDSVTVNAIGGSSTAEYLRAKGVSDATVKRWQNDPLGLLLSPETARRCGWQTGQGIQPIDLSGNPLPVHVLGVTGDQEAGLVALAHFDYINRHHSFAAGPGHVLRYSVIPTDPGETRALVTRIVTEFAHDDPPLAAYPDTVRQSARARFGNVQNLVAVVMAGVFLLCLLVVASVMAHAAAERRATLGMLRVLGFARRVLVWASVLEVIGIVLVGAVVGIGLGQLVLVYLPGWLQGRFLGVQPAPWAWTLLPFWLALLAVLSLLQPSHLAARAQPLDCQVD